MKKILKNFIYYILSLFSHDGAVILMYHSVAENREYPTVKPAAFARQLEYLYQNNFQVIKLSRFAEMMERKEKIPAKTVCLTFDDGYEDNFLNVLPLLKKYDFPATIFVSTALIGKNKPLDDGAKFVYLDEKEIREMSASGLIDFGSHGHNHVKFTTLRPDALEAELNQSKKILENLTGKNIESLSYPIGRYNEETEDVTKKLFKIICTVESGRVSLLSPAWRLPRNSVDSEVSFTQFKGIAKYGRL